MESESISEAREPAAASKPAAPAANWPASKPWAETGHQRGHQNQMKKSYLSSGTLTCFHNCKIFENETNINIIWVSHFGRKRFQHVSSSISNLIVNLFQRSTLHFYGRSDQFDPNLFLTLIFFIVLWNEGRESKLNRGLYCYPHPAQNLFKLRAELSNAQRYVRSEKHEAYQHHQKICQRKSCCEQRPRTQKICHAREVSPKKKSPMTNTFFVQFSSKTPRAKHEGNSWSTSCVLETPWESGQFVKMHDAPFGICPPTKNAHTHTHTHATNRLWNHNLQSISPNLQQHRQTWKMLNANLHTIKFKNTSYKFWSWEHGSCNTRGFLQCLLHWRRRLQPESKIRPWRFEVPNLALHKTSTSQSYREPRPLTRFKAAQHIIPCFVFENFKCLFCWNTLERFRYAYPMRAASARNCDKWEGDHCAACLPPMYRGKGETPAIAMANCVGFQSKIVQCTSLGSKLSPLC